jgi:hypothetical protein
MKKIHNLPFFILDVDVLNLHEEAFTVAGGVFHNLKLQSEFQFCCSLENITTSYDYNKPYLIPTHSTPAEIQNAFWLKWIKAREQYSNIEMIGDCVWPIITNFISACIQQNFHERQWFGPYPLHEISSMLLMAGMNHMILQHERANWSKDLAYEPLQNVKVLAKYLTIILQSKSF